MSKTKLVLRINELYHDIEDSDYEHKHPEIFMDEQLRWDMLAQNYFSKISKKLNILDIGSGTGFVPLTIGKHLKITDFVICSDISRNILNTCAKNVIKKQFKCAFSFIKLDGNNINLPDNFVDYITLNSVLHHIPDLKQFFKEVNRLLDVNGRIIICHEPNRYFYNHFFMFNNYRFLSLFFYPKHFLASILRKLGLYNFFKKVYSGFNKESKKYTEIALKINNQLMREGLIYEPLDYDKILSMVDIHSPSSGAGKGISIDQIRSHLPNFKVEIYETYNHLCKIKRLKRYECWLKKRFSNQGSCLMVVLRKDY